MNEVRKPGKQLERATFRTSRLLDFCSEKELIAQTGHRPEAWPLVVLKELVDNALDACEEARIAPEITVKVDDTGITVSDNGPGIPAETVVDVLDFSIRVSSREAYVAPDRGAQGNALKTIVAMPFVLDGESGRVEVATATGRHRITFGVNAIRQEPVIAHDHAPEEHLEIGTEITVVWPVSALLNHHRRQGPFFTICQRLYLDQPTPDAASGLVRRGHIHRRDRRRLGEVEAVRPHLSALVWPSTLGAADRRVRRARPRQRP